MVHAKSTFARAFFVAIADGAKHDAARGGVYLK